MVLPIARSIPEDTLGDRRRRALGKRMQPEVAHQACVVAWLRVAEVFHDRTTFLSSRRIRVLVHSDLDLMHNGITDLKLT